MALFERKKRPLARSELTERDDRIFIVATEDTYAPEQYFNFLKVPRVKIRILPTVDGKSSPQAVLDRMKSLLSTVDLWDDDQKWLLIDTDHWIKATHARNLRAVLKEAKQLGIFFALSNPCFDLWLLLHHEELPPGTNLANAGEIKSRLQSALGGFNKTNIRAEDYDVPKAIIAIERGKRLDRWPNRHWPRGTATHVYKLVEAVFKAARSQGGTSGKGSSPRGAPYL